MKRTLLAIAIGAISAGLGGGAMAQDGESAESDSERNDAAMEAQTTETAETQSSDQGDESQDSQNEGSDSQAQDSQGEETGEAQGTPAGDDAGDAPPTEDEETQATGGDESVEPVEDTEAALPEEGDDASDYEQATASDSELDTGQAGSDEGFDDLDNPESHLDPSIADMTAGDLKGMTIVNLEGETIGDVEQVLKHKDSGDLQATTTVGGFWVFGGTEVALPLADMQLEGEQLVFQQPLGEDELEGLGQEYDEERHETVDDDMNLSDAEGL
ncbi:PRC-barrel domain-containing protein [Billgrantia pellis]|nr:PRC-barrel domain-containing protein [Halomonas pellis]